MPVVALVGPYPPEVLDLLIRLLPPGFEVLQIGDYEEFSRAEQADFLILRTLQLNADAIDGFPRLKLIQRWGVGYDTVDIEAAGERGIPVAIAHGVNSAPVAELTVLLMLAVMRRLTNAHEDLRSGGWNRQACIEGSFGLLGKTVGLVGCGSIGQKVCRRLQPFGVRLIYHDVEKLEEEVENELSLRFAELEELLSEADVVSLHVPLIPETQNLIDRRRLALLKPTAVLINTSRGGLIDEEALVEALQGGKLQGVGLDTFVQEPLDVASPLRSLSNAVLTPHIGGNTRDSGAAMVEKCVDNILKVHGGGRPVAADLVNAQFLGEVTTQEHPRS